MARKTKISLEEAYSLEHAYKVFEHHNLEVQVTGIKEQPEAAVPVEDLFDKKEMDYSYYPPQPRSQRVRPVFQHLVRLELAACHNVGSGGELRQDGHGGTVHVSNETKTYGPGVVHVPHELAEHLAYQDMVAREQDRKTFDPHPRYHVIGFYRAPGGREAVRSVDVTDNPQFIQDGMDLIHFGLMGGLGIRL